MYFMYQQTYVNEKIIKQELGTKLTTNAYQNRKGEYILVYS